MKLSSLSWIEYIKTIMRLLRKISYRKRTIISVLFTILIINYFTVGFIKYTITREIRKQFFSPEVIYHSPFDEELLEDNNGVKYCSYTKSIVGELGLNPTTTRTSS